MADLPNTNSLVDELRRIDPALYRKAVSKLAEAHPEVDVPEVRLANEMDAVRAESARQIDELKSALQAEKDSRVAAEALAKVKAESGLDEKGLEATTKFMQDNGITDINAGLKFQRLTEAEAARNKIEPQDRNTMALPQGVKDVVSGKISRQRYRRGRLYEGLTELRTQQARAERLASM